MHFEFHFGKRLAFILPLYIHMHTPPFLPPTKVTHCKVYFEKEEEKVLTVLTTFVS